MGGEEAEKGKGGRKGAHTQEVKEEEANLEGIRCKRDDKRTIVISYFSTIISRLMKRLFKPQRYALQTASLPT